MSQVFIKTITPVASVPTTNIIMCKHDISDAKLEKFSQDLEKDVARSQNEMELDCKTVYALETKNGWRRAVVKFVRKDGVRVIQAIDWREKPINFCPQIHNVRKIQSDGLRNRTPAYFKLMIYGLGTYMFDDEYYSIFDQLIMNQPVTGIFTLLEPKPNIVNECYIGDLLYIVKGQSCSFRELLIRLNISYPSRVRTNVNQRILFARTNFLSRGQVTLTAPSSNASSLQNEFGVPVSVIGGRVNIYEVLGEGSVCSYSRSRFVYKYYRI